jgi:polyribonucleotide nucleotidyltransferase
MSKGHVRVEAVIGGKKLALETGEVARQAAGSVVASIDETMVFAAVVVGPEKRDSDFFPLTCTREKTEAAGKIPAASSSARAARPRRDPTMRLIDRAIRPMSPDGFRRAGG